MTSSSPPLYLLIILHYSLNIPLRHQNNFASQPTQVRVVLHLQDVRIIALGVLLLQPSLFVNPNAHLLLHPPLLRGLASEPVRQSRSQIPTSENVLPRPQPAATPSDTAYGAHIPIARSTSRSESALASDSLGEKTLTSTPAAVPPSSPSMRTTLAKAFAGRTRRMSGTNDPADEAGGSRQGGVLTTVRSRDSDDGRRKRWSFGRALTGSMGGPENEAGPSEPRAVPETAAPAMPSLAELPLLEPSASHQPHATSSKLPDSHRYRNPYTLLQKPLPLSTHRLFPNHTPSTKPPPLAPFEFDHEPEADISIPIKMDCRVFHEEVEDDSNGILWSAGEAIWSGDGTKMAEWDDVQNIRKRWVGPMM